MTAGAELTEPERKVSRLMDALEQAVNATKKLILVEGGRSDDLPFVVMRGNPATGTPIAAFRNRADADAFLARD